MVSLLYRNKLLFLILFQLIRPDMSFNKSIFILFAKLVDVWMPPTPHNSRTSPDPGQLNDSHKDATHTIKFLERALMRGPYL